MCNCSNSRPRWTSFKNVFLVSLVKEIVTVRVREKVIQPLQLVKMFESFINFQERRKTRKRSSLTRTQLQGPASPDQPASKGGGAGKEESKPVSFRFQRCVEPWTEACKAGRVGWHRAPLDHLWKACWGLQSLTKVLSLGYKLTWSAPQIYF